jgi:hypothetical protein
MVLGKKDHRTEGSTEETTRAKHGGFGNGMLRWVCEVPDAFWGKCLDAGDVGSPETG